MSIERGRGLGAISRIMIPNHVMSDIRRPKPDMGHGTWDLVNFVVFDSIDVTRRPAMKVEGRGGGNADKPETPKSCPSTHYPVYCSVLK
jgi:hypothetical protein